MIIYIAGIMFYKTGLEFFNGSITTLATDRFKAAQTFTKLGAAQGLNQAAQCVGAILIAPLIKRWPTRTVLASSILFFSVMTTLLLIVDAATGGQIRFKTDDNKVHYGNWNPNAIFIIWTFSGIAYGMVELIRRVIPCDIVGGDAGKLRRMDATVHVFYEIVGTSAAIASSAAITKFGNNYSFFLTPVFFVFAGITWFFVSIPRSSANAAGLAADGLEKVEGHGHGGNYLVQLFWGFVDFGKSVWVGFNIIFSSRKFIWLFPGYAVALYLHRFLENSLAPAFAKRVLGTSAWSQIIVGGSNFGELLGALSVFVLADRISTPIPWLRADALALNLIWLLPFYSTIAEKNIGWAWRVAATFIPISFGWAAGDVSLAAYIQSAITAGGYSSKYTDVSALGAVMSFLYSSYIVMNAVFSSVLGAVVDKEFTAEGNIYTSLQMVGGVHFTVCSVIIFLATFIPKGSFALNPKAIDGIRNEQEFSEDASVGSDVKGDTEAAKDKKEEES